MYLFLIKVKHTYLTLDEGPVGWEAWLCLSGVYRFCFSKKSSTGRTGRKASKRYLLEVPFSLHVSGHRSAQEGEIPWIHHDNYLHVICGAWATLFWEFLSTNVIWTPVQPNCWGLWPWRSLMSDATNKGDTFWGRCGGDMPNIAASMQSWLFIWMLR